MLDEHFQSEASNNLRARLSALAYLAKRFIAMAVLITAASSSEAESKLINVGSSAASIYSSRHLERDI